jgi:hypothetical protein
MKRDVLSVFGTLVAAAAVFGLITMSMTMAAANEKFQTFADGTATVVQNPSGTFTITLASNTDDGGVYITAKPSSGKGIGGILFSFTSSGDVAGGAPRFSIPIDTDGKAATVEFYAFLDAAGCGAVSGDTISVSTASATCAVNAGPESFANWAAFAAAHPTYRVAPGWHPFIIADGTAGTYIVSNIDLR